jgi:hypothetical protein
MAAAAEPSIARSCGHKADREKGIVPHTPSDPAAHWTKLGGHGWVDGWKLHLLTTVAAIWFPLAADLPPADIAANVQALPLGDHLPHDAPTRPRFLVGDAQYNDPTLWERGEPRTASGSRRSGGAIPITTMGARSAASSTSRAPMPSRASLASSRASSIVWARSRPAAPSWALSLSTTWPCSSATRPAVTGASVSKHSYRQHSEL